MYCINSHWQLTTNHSLLHMKNPVIAAPTYKGFLGANFNYDRWSIVTGLQYISGLYTAVADNERLRVGEQGSGMQKENFCLLNATVNYALCKTVGLWMRGENLLAQSYEINLGYPMPRATFMGGVNLSF